MPSKLEYISTTIASGTTTNAIPLGAGKSLVGVYIPSGISSTSVTFTASPTADGTYSTVARNNTTITEGVTASRLLTLDPVKFAAIEFLKIVTSASETDKTFTLVVKVIE